MDTLLDIDGYEVNDLRDVCDKIADVLPLDGVIAIYGEMGVGKTTLVKELCKVLGVEDAVSSPTFGLVNVYKAGDRVINHVDLYRLKNAEEAESAGVFELFYSQALTFVEWPERIADHLPLEVMVLKIELCEKFNHDSSRKLVLQRP
jgi:tRNA threonylcarbamoyladenosine biosynthesis protein TsaE